LATDGVDEIPLHIPALFMGEAYFRVTVVSALKFRPGNGEQSRRPLVVKQIGGHAGAAFLTSLLHNDRLVV
jgi:hypothetical protein